MEPNPKVIYKENVQNLKLLSV